MRLRPKTKHRKKHKLEITSLNNMEMQLKIGDLDEERIKELFRGCGDVVIEHYHFGDGDHVSTVLLTYCVGMCDTQQMSNHILPRLEELFEETQFRNATSIENGRNIPISPLSKDQDIKHLIHSVFGGMLLILFIELGEFYVVNIANPPLRSPEEPNTEASIRGPKDGFVEDLNVNIAIIRKRLKTASLQIEYFVLGHRSGTRVGLLYIKDVINMKFIEDVRERLQKVDIDIILSNNQLEDILADSSISIFPLFDYSGRPDFVVQCLIKGRFLLVVDGSPTVSIAPVNLLELIKAPEDIHFNFAYVTFARVLRLVGLLIALLLPGFYISLVSYNMDQIPFFLLATISNSRVGIPVSPPFELLLVLGLYELFREAGLRLPKAVGQTLTVVGGLIIGDAAIRAGLTSPSMVVIASLVAVARYTLVNQVNSGTITIMSFLIFMISTVFGLFGFFISSFAVLLLLANLKSFGLPYLSPMAPIKLRDVLPAFFMLPWKVRKKRPDMLNTNDTMRQGDNS